MGRLATSLFVAFSALNLACSAPFDAAPSKARADAGAGDDEEPTGEEGATPARRDAGASTGGSAGRGTGGGGGADAGRACAPSATPPSFTPSYKPPVANGAGKCTDAQLTALAKACFGSGGTDATCDAFFAAAANGTCASCLVQPDAAATFGPLIPGFGVNVYGCVALIENDFTKGSCAAAIATADECTARACATCADATSAQTCQNQAATSTCASYGSASQACIAKLPAAAADKCLAGANDTAESWAKRVAGLFCGTR